MTSPRILPAFKTFRHALTLVRDNSALGIRISLLWTAILLILAIAEITTGAPPTEGMAPEMSPLQLVSAAVGFVAFASIAVNWHRYVLRDEAPLPPSGLRLDHAVWRYAGNALAVGAALVVPTLAVMAITTQLPPLATVLVLPTLAISAALAMTLSIKLPAVALGRADFTFRQAIAAASGSLWPLLGLFFLYVAAASAGIVVIILAASLAYSIHPLAETIVGLTLASVMNIFFTLLSISVATSIYGYLVERREF